MLASALVLGTVTAAAAATAPRLRRPPEPDALRITRASTQHIDISWTPPADTAGIKGYFVFLEEYPAGYTDGLRHGSPSATQEFYAGADTTSTDGDSLSRKFGVDPTFTYRAQVFSATRSYDTDTTLYVIHTPENVGWNYSDLYRAPEGTSDGDAPHPALVGAVRYRVASCRHELTVSTSAKDLQREWDGYLAMYQTDAEQVALGIPALATTTPYPAITGITTSLYRDGERWRTWRTGNESSTTPVVVLPPGAYTASSTYTSVLGDGAETFSSTHYTVLDCSIDEVRPTIRMAGNGVATARWAKPDSHANHSPLIYRSQVFLKKAAGWKRVQRSTASERHFGFAAVHGHRYRVVVTAEDSTDPSWSSTSTTSFSAPAR